MANKYLTTTATWTAATKTVSGASMSADFAAADEGQPVFFRVGATIYHGWIASVTDANTAVMQAIGLLPSTDQTIDDLFTYDHGKEHAFLVYFQELQSLIRDDVTKLTITDGGDLDKILRQAVTQYGKDKGFSVRKKITGNDTGTYSLVTILGSLFTPDFTFVEAVEYPLGSNPPEELDSDRFYIHDDGTAQDGTNLNIVFTDIVPTSSEFFIVKVPLQLDVPRSGVQNFPDTDEHFANITVLAASMACDRLAAAYAQSSDATITADVVNYQDKSDKYRRLAEAFRARYNIAVFGDEDPDTSVGAAFSTKTITSENQESGSFLFHGRRGTS